jgi:SAM-dependent methyltransferase
LANDQGRSETLVAAWDEYFARLLEEQPRHPGARDFMAEDLRQALGRLIPEEASVLDVGCGTGDLLARLPHKVKLGVDRLPKAIEQARQRHTGISFRVGDTSDLGEVGSFDAVVCDRLAHSVQDIRALLVSLRERLTDTGRVYLTAFNYLWEMPARMAEAAGWKIASPTANWLTEFDYKNLFDLAGLEAVRHEDRLMMPLGVPGLATVVNRYLAKLPGLRALSLYRIYVLRKRATAPMPS